MAVMPTNVLSFMSDIAPLVTAMIGAPSLSGTLASLPLFVAIARVLPSIFWSVPRTLAGVSSATALMLVATHAATTRTTAESLILDDMHSSLFWRIVLARYGTPDAA